MLGWLGGSQGSTYRASYRSQQENGASRPSMYTEGERHGDRCVPLCEVPHGGNRGPRIRLGEAEAAPLLEFLRKHGWLVRIQAATSAGPGLPGPSALTDRQLEGLQAVWRHSSPKATAGGLGIAEGTVRSHVRDMCRRVGVGRRDELVCRACHWGLINGCRPGLW